MRKSKVLNKKSGRKFVLGSILLVLFILMTLLTPLVLHLNPYETHRRDPFQAPCKRFLLGTDEIGRDIFARVLSGSRVSLTTIAVALLISVPTGILFGMTAGYLGGIWDLLLMRAIDVWLAFPAFVVAIVLVIAIGPGGLTAMLAIGFVSIPRFIRVARAQTIAVKEEDYVGAAVAMGASTSHILLRTILPNIKDVIIVQMVITAGYAVLMEAALSFLGLGTNPPDPSWGSMLRKASVYLSQAPWYGIFPGALLTVLIYIMNMMSDSLRRFYTLR